MILRFIRKSLAFSLSLSILMGTLLIVLITMGFLYFRSRQQVRQVAIDEMSQSLHNTRLHIRGVLNEVETATINTEWAVLHDLNPDSLFKISQRILQINPNLYGCSIAMAPDFFPAKGHYFSAYSSNEDGHIMTEQEGNDDYNYFEMPWYKLPMTTHKPCWIDPYHDYNSEEETYEKEMITTYSRPLVGADGRYIGVIAADLSHRRLSQLLAIDPPYPNSYYLLLNHEGKLIASGNENATLDDLRRDNCTVVHETVPRTGWTICVVCPRYDIYKNFRQPEYIIGGIVLFGLLLILLAGYIVVRLAVSPLKLLADQTQHIAQGDYDEPLPKSNRVDEIGQLQNTFAAMQQSISGYVSDLQQVRQQTEERNEELVVAKAKAEESDHKKTEFIQELTHQIRTPLNIISGFAQVLQTDSDNLEDEDLDSISKGILQNSKSMATIIDNLHIVSSLEDATSVELNDTLHVNGICQQAIERITLIHPHTVSLTMETRLPDNFLLRTHRAYLQKILSELLENANKFTKVGLIILRCQQYDPRFVEITVSDTGQGIPPADRERIFSLFTKLSTFSEGLGLGLYLTRRLARLMGGDLRLDDTYVGGTRFILQLPV